MRFIHLSFLFLLAFFCNSCNGQKDGYAISKDNTPIYYKTFGDGKPLLIINGGPGMNSEGFESLAKQLSENRMTIIYDQRGTGKSALPILDSTTISMQLMIDDIESIRKTLKIEKWSVLGHSFGGMLASYYATQNPESIDKLILSSSGGIDLGLLNYVNESINSKLTKSQLDSVSYWNEKINAGDTSHFAKLQKGKNLAHAYVIDPKYLPVIAERLTQGNPTVNQLIWNSLFSIQFDCAEKLKTFDHPVLIIQGKEDIIHSETAEIAHKVLKHSKVVYMEHCIHYGWLDNEKVYFREINSFLA
ncbi:alpha/beta hydrolase [soil metagenome]